MGQVRVQPLGPLLSGEGSRAFLGLTLEEGLAPAPIVLVWAPEEVVRDTELTAQLERETQRATHFQHPHILRVHGLVKLEGGVARVTEYADGEPLRRILEVSPRLPPPFAARVVADAALGLHYAHLAGNGDGTPFVHGDVRPETLMVSYSGVCKVSGYGALSVAPKERGGRRVRNRRLYAAPEQLLGGREAADVQTDVFLLGLVLYECLAGKLPFKNTLDPDGAMLTQALPPLPGDVPRALDTVVRGATSKRAYHRFASALAFREAVEEAVGGLPPHEAFAEYLSGLFPPEGEVRRARRQLLDAGLAATRSASTEAASATTPPVPLVIAPAPPTPAPEPRSGLALGDLFRALLPWATVAALLALVAFSLLRQADEAPAAPGPPPHASPAAPSGHPAAPRMATPSPP